MSKLNKDILFLIFEELQIDSKSLFSCLMVNELWCETVVPILWRNPWRYNINYGNKPYLFIIITSYLSDNTKEFLIEQGIQLPSASYQSLFFDYLSFCRSININIINIIIYIGSSLVYNQFILQQELYILFMKKFQEIKHLDMGSINHQIFYFPEARIRLESLCELICDTTIDSSYFYGLARLCQYIQRLVIFNINPRLNHGIVKLIEVQMNLKYFEWEDDINLEFTHTSHKEVLLALEKKADIINHLKISFLYTDHTLQRVLPKLHKLKTLTINDFGRPGEDQLKMLVYHNLEILIVDCILLNEAANIIKNSGGHLRKILLKPFDFGLHDENFTKDSLFFICKIYENCPLIEYLTIAFSPSEENFTEFEKLLKVCQNLKSLLFTILNMDALETDEKILENGEEFLKVLIKSKPTNLREIRFFNDVKFSLEALEEFFGKWKGCALTVLTTNSIYEEEDYKELINKYKNDGVIKDFRRESFINVENMDFKL
jgi:hypothetical protein